VSVSREGMRIGRTRQTELLDKIGVWRMAKVIIVRRCVNLEGDGRR